MTYQACEDCGTRMYGGLCPNCQEEAYIFENQDTDEAGLSDAFMTTVHEQQEERRRRKNANG
jgi:hypothetical protein